MALQDDDIKIIKICCLNKKSTAVIAKNVDLLSRRNIRRVTADEYVKSVG